MTTTPKHHRNLDFWRDTAVILIVTVICAVFCAAAGISTVAAAPAAPRPATVTQPDGTIISVITTGDERGSWLATPDGTPISQDTDTGWWTPDHTAATRAPARINRDATLAPAAAPAKAPAGGHVRPVLTIMVDFDTRPGGAGHTPDSVHDLLFAPDASAAAWFTETTDATVRLIPATESHGTSGDGVIGWLRIAPTHPNPSNDYIAALNAITRPALAAAEPFIDFPAYDANNDGVVAPEELTIIIIAAGAESSYDGRTPGVWAHRLHVTGSYQYDSPSGISITDYAMAGELHGNHAATVGPIVHELGHLVMNWPDLYDTDGSSFGVGVFDVMGTGSWCAAPGRALGTSPVHPSAYLTSTHGIRAPRLVLPGETGVTLAAGSYPARLDTDTPGVYYLAQVRAPVGFDKGLSTCANLTDGGILLTRIDESATDNANDTARLVDVIEAGDVKHLDGISRGEAENLFFAGNADSFSGEGITIANVSVASSTMSFDAGAHAPRDPRLSISATAVHFGRVTPGLSARTTITIGNTGADALSLAGFRIDDPARFGFETDCPALLHTGATCTATLTYAPGAPGVHAASFFFAASGASTAVALTGTGSEATLTSDAAALDFGPVEPGLAITLPLTITNTGTEPAAITGMTLTGEDTISFFADAADCASIAPGAACTVPVTFAPADTGFSSASIVLTSQTDTLTTALTGIGTTENATIVPRPGSVALGHVAAGGSVSAPVDLYNIGRTELFIESVTESHEYLSVSGCTGATVPAGGFCRAVLTYAPNAPDSLDTAVTVTSTDQSRPVVVIPVTGDATDAPTAKAAATAAAGGCSAGDTGSPLTLVIFILGASILRRRMFFR